MPGHRHRFACAVVASGLALASLTACSGEGDTDQLVVGFVVDPSWAQIPVADEAGYFADAGLDVKVVNFATGVEAIQALSAGQVDVTTAADVPTAAALATDHDLRVVADGSVWTGSVIVGRRDSGIRTAKDLAGKRIGTPLGTSAAYFASRFLKATGVSAELVQVAPPAILTAATQGDVDAVSIFQPYQEQVIDGLGADGVKVDAGDGAYRQHSLYLSTKDVLSSRKAELKKFFDALGSASDDLAASDPEALRVVSKVTQLEPSLVDGILGEFTFGIEDPEPLAPELSELGVWAREQGKVAESTELPDYAAYLESSVVGS